MRGVQAIKVLLFACMTGVPVILIPFISSIRGVQALLQPFLVSMNGVLAILVPFLSTIRGVQALLQPFLVSMKGVLAILVLLLVSTFVSSTLCPEECKCLTRAAKLTAECKNVGMSTVPDGLDKALMVSTSFVRINCSEYLFSGVGSVRKQSDHGS